MVEGFLRRHHSTNEAVGRMVSWVSLLHDGHVRVDIIYPRLGAKGQAWIN